MKILENIKDVVITVIVALIVYCICVPSPAHATTLNDSYNTFVDKVVADTVYCTVEGNQYSFYSDDDGVYYQGEDINVILEDNCIVKAHSNAKVVQGTIVTNVIETDMFDINDDKLYLYGVNTSNGIVYFDTIDNTWQQGDNVNLTVNNNGYVVGVEWLE